MITLFKYFNTINDHFFISVNKIVEIKKSVPICAIMAQKGALLFLKKY